MCVGVVQRPLDHSPVDLGSANRATDVLIGGAGYAMLRGAHCHGGAGEAGNCVEVAALPDGADAVRSSRRPTGPTHVYTRTEIAAFRVRAADFAERWAPSDR